MVFLGFFMVLCFFFWVFIVFYGFFWVFYGFMQVNVKMYVCAYDGICACDVYVYVHVMCVNGFLLSFLVNYLDSSMLLPFSF